MTMDAAKIHDRLMRAEVNGRLAPDHRRALRDERQVLGLKLASGDPAKVQAAADEARRVARLWDEGEGSSVLG